MISRKTKGRRRNGIRRKEKVKKRGS